MRASFGIQIQSRSGNGPIEVRCTLKSRGRGDFTARSRAKRARRSSRSQISGDADRASAAFRFGEFNAAAGKCDKKSRLSGQRQRVVALSARACAFRAKFRGPAECTPAGAIDATKQLIARVASRLVDRRHLALPR